MLGGRPDFRRASARITLISGSDILAWWLGSAQAYSFSFNSSTFESFLIVSTTTIPNPDHTPFSSTFRRQFAALATHHVQHQTPATIKDRKPNPPARLECSPLCRPEPVFLPIPLPPDYYTTDFLARRAPAVLCMSVSTITTAHPSPCPKPPTSRRR